MAIARYNDEWKKIFERMGQENLPLFKRIGTKATLFDVKRKYRGADSVVVISHLTKIVNVDNKPEEGYDKLRLSEKDGFKCATMYFVPAEADKPMQKLYAFGIKGEVGAVIDYTDEKTSYTFRYTDKDGFSKIEKHADKEGGAEKPADVIEEAVQSKKDKKSKWDKWTSGRWFRC